MMVASRIDKLTRSGIRRVMQLSADAERAGKTVIHMEVGQPDFPTPVHIQQAAEKAITEGKTGYTACAGILELREAVATRISTRTKIPIDAKNVCVTSGAVNAISLALSSVLEPNDEVLVPDPGWPNYHSAVLLAGGKSIAYPLVADKDYQPDFVELEKLVTPRTKIIFVNTPGNPTGVSWTVEVLKRVADFAERHNILIISDEVYEDMVFSGRHVSMLEVAPKERVLLVSGVSKSYAMTGWRIGWLVASPEIVEAAAALVEPMTTCPPAPSQYGAVAALTGPQDSVDHMRATYKERLAEIEPQLLEAGVLVARPSGGFFAMLDISGCGMTSDTFVERLLHEKGVAVAPGATFGPSAENCVRISFATNTVSLKSGVEKILSFIAEARAAQHPR
ncbi:pyridoxal phosphate-dependent aminotransferase [Pseudomonas gingeri NCPPB 3146 = LMG 5327]|uniref:Aminotransferase n=2 Tax=Pseudomonas gingeri TaxID=117681 RepID=A0A7Y7Y2F4_9PSED|nr:pyridoxal phosphate-dependent aminotransferase [Pseudomonas gingeri]NWC16531.1 pyridoxal phosphate-dependent aminotransferase [Pseudomonas gingeri]PNQ91114.1 pyridoxal phosphate-dependent aminotransferase [Pseudomonas gingeri NCPPB 3146 = LMG 5327]